MRISVKMGRNIKSLWVLFALLMGLLAMVGCESKKEMADPKATLKTLAEEYWTKRFVDKDYEFTYDLELEKDSIPFEDYVNQIKRGERFKVYAVETKEVNMEGDRGQVLLTVYFKLPQVSKGKELNMALQDLWIIKSNTWKHKFSDK